MTPKTRRMAQKSDSLSEHLSKAGTARHSSLIGKCVNVVDPDRMMTPTDRERAAQKLRSAYYGRIGAGRKPGQLIDLWVEIQASEVTMDPETPRTEHVKKVAR